MRTQFFPKKVRPIILFLLLSGYTPNSLGMKQYNPGLHTPTFFISNFAPVDIEGQRQQVLENLSTRIQQMTDIKAWERMTLEHRNAEQKQWRTAEDAAQEARLWQTRGLPPNDMRPGETVLDGMKAVGNSMAALWEDKIYGSGKLFVSPPLSVNVSDVQEVVEGWIYKLYVLHSRLQSALEHNPFDSTDKGSMYDVLGWAIDTLKSAREETEDIQKIVWKIVEPLQKEQLEDQRELLFWTQGFSNWKEANERMFLDLTQARDIPMNPLNSVMDLIDMGKRLLAVQKLEPDIIQWKNKMIRWINRQDVWYNKIPKRLHKMLNLKSPKTQGFCLFLKTEYTNSWFEELMKQGRIYLSTVNLNVVHLIDKWEKEDQEVWNKEEWIAGQAQKVLRDLDSRLQEMSEGDWKNKMLEQREAARQKWLELEGMAQDVSLWKVYSTINSETQNISAMDFESDLLFKRLSNFKTKGEVFSSYTHPHFILPNLDESTIQKALDTFLVKMNALKLETLKIWKARDYCITPNLELEHLGGDKYIRFLVRTVVLTISGGLILEYERHALIPTILASLRKKQINMGVMGILELTEGETNWKQATEIVRQQLEQNPTAEGVDRGKKLLAAQEWEPDMQKWRTDTLKTLEFINKNEQLEEKCNKEEQNYIKDEVNSSKEEVKQNKEKVKRKNDRGNSRWKALTDSLYANESILNMIVMEISELTDGETNWKQAIEIVRQQLEQNPTAEGVDRGEKRLAAQKWGTDSLKTLEFINKNEQLEEKCNKEEQNYIKYEVKSSKEEVKQNKEKVKRKNDRGNSEFNTLKDSLYSSESILNMGVMEISELTEGETNWKPETEIVRQQLKQNPTAEGVDRGEKRLAAQEWESDMQKWGTDSLKTFINKNEQLEEKCNKDEQNYIKDEVKSSKEEVKQNKEKVKRKNDRGNSEFNALKDSLY